MATDKQTSRSCTARRAYKGRRRKNKAQENAVSGASQLKTARPHSVAPPVSRHTTPRPITKVKHKVLFELVENREKKKKLEFTTVRHKVPPPGYAFVACGNPELTTACKELSRDRGELMFIVSPQSLKLNGPHLGGSSRMNEQINRVGYHFVATTVRDALASTSQPSAHLVPIQSEHTAPGLIPADAKVYLEQVEASFQELLPRMPNSDRQTIINSAFYWNPRRTPVPPVGLQFQLPLTQRVHLATVAHIRHQHTEYDELLRNGSEKAFARTQVRSKCIDILVKWRGDDETGRDQFEEILREVIIISDTDDEDDHLDSLTDAMDTTMDDAQDYPPGLGALTPEPRGPIEESQSPGDRTCAKPGGSQRHGRRGFKRYHAYEEAFRRQSESDAADSTPVLNVPTREKSVAERLATDRDQTMTFGSVGDTPTSNGFVRQAQHGQPLPGSDRLQDMLVPSIEPPEAGLPAVADVLLDYSAHHGGPALFAERGFSSRSHRLPSRRVMSDQWPHRPCLSNFNETSGGLTRTEPLIYSSAGCAREDAFPVPVPPAERLVMNVGRPGSRSNPIHMEDRGGFFEIVRNTPERESLELEMNGFVEVSRPMNRTLQASERLPELLPRRDERQHGWSQSFMHRPGSGPVSISGAHGARALHHQTYWQT
ncbi:hypothetical protein CDD82_4513 [Ophiocordyceps australis]|uniref:DUF2293 domain-containing protein n=1 Tax=Ophiocordyceps australis TaxID=1399860 RepID=A0A2C5YB31_9HYPO|nr:hypothetical protein CDD82_4513 [Ophiocordyceps australis]